MRLHYTPKPHWPTLAWLASVTPGGDMIDVHHGSGVETTADWFCEAAWPGPFAAGDFDQTDRVFGSGGRVRWNAVTFVSAASTLDRLVWFEDAQRTLVSNSLPCLMQAIGATIDPADVSYVHLLGGIRLGIDKYPRQMPTSAGDVKLAYYHNLAWDGTHLREAAKPAATPPFTTFAEYRGLLIATITDLAANAADLARTFPFRLLGTMSSGYDSACVAALAKPAGLTEVISFTHSKLGKSDSGEPAAKALGLKLLLIDRDAYRGCELPEVGFVSTDAKGEDVYFAGAAEHLTGRLLLTGYTGDLNWDLECQYRGPGFTRGDRAGLSLSEYRLRAGFLHVPVPYLGALRQEAIVAISHDPAMKPWDFGGSYSRPIPRRILEEAGVPRGSFATEKKAASVMLAEVRDQLSASSTRDFHAWLVANAGAFWKRHMLPPLVKEKWLSPVRKVARRGWSVHAQAQRLPRAFGVVARLSRGAAEWSAKERLNRFLFPWAIDRAKRVYADETPMPAAGAAGIGDVQRPVL